MSLHLLSHFLLRAPLLPVSGLRDSRTALRRHPLGKMVVALASPDLAEALARKSGPAAQAALSRYTRRAAFRPTPAGLLAGVSMGRLGSATRIATDKVQAILTPSWERVAAVGRALLEQPELRWHVRLRLAPSLMAAGEQAVWLGLDRRGLQVRFGEVDSVLAAVIEQAQDWAPWARVGQAVQRAAASDPDAADELLLVLIDRGVLCHDLAPPLVGRPAATWLLARLARLPAGLNPLIEPIRQGLSATGDLTTIRAALAGLPGADHCQTDVAGTLRHCPRRVPTLSRRAVGRAAACAPLLFRLQEALAGPVAERACDAGLAESIESMAEVFGAGAFDLADLATGAYGHTLAATDEEPSGGVPRLEVLALLADAVAQAAAAGAQEIALDRERLDAILPEVDLPPSFEMFLSPCRQPARTAPGTGWLLGLHAPAGASWGRYAAALGAEMDGALRELAVAEEQARPGEAALDVVYAPSPELADLCTHPPVRKAALALCGWPEGAALSASQLALVVDPSAPEPWALRAHTGQPVAPRPLHRVRSSTAPPGIYRLLAGWSFARQHAPWALTWGTLAGLAFLPRVRLDGFVVAPASWRVPPAAEMRRPGALARWRRRYRVPPAVQAGEGDELLYLDLRAKGAARELARFSGGRLFEIWPSLRELPDRGGRRVEAVVAVVHVPEGDEAEGRRFAIEATRLAGQVASPARTPPAEDWVTFRLYGAPERQDAVLFEVVAPTVRAAFATREIDAWFFLPYLGEPGGRHHLRLRAHAASAGKLEVFARRLRRALEPLRARGDVVCLESAEYFRESARYGGESLMPAVERLFQASSELALACLEAQDQGTAEPDRLSLALRAADALAGGLGLDLQARQGLARRCRDACSAAGLLDEEHARQTYRQQSRQLMSWLAGGQEDVLTPALVSLHTTAAALAGSLDADLRATLQGRLPVLLHVQAVRLLGANPGAEALSYYLWQRILESLAAQRGAGNGRTPTNP